MNSRHIACVRYFNRALFDVTKEKSENPVLLQVIGWRVWFGNCRTQI